MLCAIGVIFVIACVPETKGRDLESIHKLFEKRDGSSGGDHVEAAVPTATTTTASKLGHVNTAMSTADEIVSCDKVDTKL